MIRITNAIALEDDEVELSAIRSQGAGGQNVNKVSSAIHLRFDIQHSSLPAYSKERLLALRDKRLTRDGTLVIKAQTHRTQEKNKQDALKRLVELIKDSLAVEKTRLATKPTRGSQRRRVDSKTLRGKIKSLRGNVKAD